MDTGVPRSLRKRAAKERRDAHSAASKEDVGALLLFRLELVSSPEPTNFPDKMLLPTPNKGGRRT